jgi:hypothetical protein
MDLDAAAWRVHRHVIDLVVDELGVSLLLSLAEPAPSRPVEGELAAVIQLRPDEVSTPH